ncbi:sloth 1 [Arctopsyche grandis]|uniref:sloth 1 n=1 Tax=Arctopsyche grandis TaxID=121162 RepID=UPI00406D8C98
MLLPWLAKVLDKWPGKKIFGVYRFLPVFVLFGAGLEFSMINWHVGETNFYNTYKKREAENLVKYVLYEEPADSLTQNQ